MATIEKSLFKNASSTYYYSSLFFPKKLKKDVFRLYSFVRFADNCVDDYPQDIKAFRTLRRTWRQYLNVQTIELSPDDSELDRVSKNMAQLIQLHPIEPGWVEDFLDAMESDLKHKPCQTFDDSLSYVYGSAEVVGLMMASIMGLPKAANDSAKMQGRAFQWINFIRDVAEDNSLGRQYFPVSELKKYGLTDLSKVTAVKHPAEFNDFMRAQISRYDEWQSVASSGYKYIPRRILVPLKTASQLYNWTADRINKDPTVVFERKVRPHKLHVICLLFKNVLRISGRSGPERSGRYR